MDEEELYKQDIQDIKNLISNLIKQCKQFADDYNYNMEWVFIRFREELNKRIRELK